MRENPAKKTAVQMGKEGRHSYLFWLLVPIVLIWLTFGYVIGLIKEKPLWQHQGKLSLETSAVVPYFQNYPTIAQTFDQSFITLWFDDAWLSQYMAAYPKLKTLAFPGTVAVPVNAIETTNYMNWAQLRTLQKNGWEITNHSLSHDCTMQTWNREKVVSEYEISKLTLWKNKLTSDIFVTPCGVDGSLMRGEAKRAFLGYRTVDPGFNDLTNLDFNNLKVKNIDSEVSVDDIKQWIDDAKQSRSWLILVFHRVGENSSDLTDESFNMRTEDFEAILEYIKLSNIQVVVPSQMRPSVAQ